MMPRATGRAKVDNIPAASGASARARSNTALDQIHRDYATDLNRGLTSSEAQSRLDRFGANELPPPRRDTLLRRAVRQITEPMSFLLIAAAMVAWLGLGEHLDAAAIAAIVVANVIIALVQEGRAANALRALRSMESPTATVRRDGHVVVIPAREIAVGDVVLIAAGDRVPADLELIEATAPEIDESILTGESLPVTKSPQPRTSTATDLGLAEQSAMVFSGTLMCKGKALGIAVATGSDTELGTIAKHLEEREPLTPLQRELRKMSSRLGIIALVIAAGVFAATLFRLGPAADSLETAFLTAAALAVAAVPEGLPTVVTVALALGVRRMAGRGSIIRRLPAVETLGSTTVILTDKTGTLTQNRMVVDSVCTLGARPQPIDELPRALGDAVAEVVALCNDATLSPDTGDPTEVALLLAIGGNRVLSLRDQHARGSLLPFDSERRSMTTANAFGNGTALLTKGAPEVILHRCTETLRPDGTVAPIDQPARERALRQAEELAGSGARVLALARRDVSSLPLDIESEEHDFTFVGLIALRDPVRPAAARAVEDAASAGIRILMVTGDHPGTASSVAHEVGLASAHSPVMVGSDIRRSGLPADPTSVSVYARVDPGEKLALAQALQAQGHVVAVTGDGVNDAPALRRADIGVAMGRSGSDVAREAADMIVTDDNLATIVDAVREGRGIYDNIRKVVDYLVAGNLSEIIVVVVGLLAFPGLGVPLLPLQLLWINLLTDSSPALALGVDPIYASLMRRSPRNRSDHLLAIPRLTRLFGRALLIAVASLGSLAIARYWWNEPWPEARTVMFSVLVTAHLLYAFVVRRIRTEGSLRRNTWLIAAVLGGLVLQIVAVSVSPLQAVLDTTSLSLREWLLVMAGGLAPVLVMLALPRFRRNAQRTDVPLTTK